MNRRSLLFGSTETLPDIFSSDTAYPSARFAVRTEAGLEPWSPSGSDVWDYSKALHLLRRCVVGPTPTEVRDAAKDGLEKTLQKLFAPFNPSLEGIESFANKDPQVRPSGTTQQEIQEFQNSVIQLRGLLERWGLKTLASSPISIQERLVWMWANHFTSEMDVVNFAHYMHRQNQLIRDNVLGDFKKFVYEITIDPAMLIYLDGFKSFKTGSRSQINENYARELMELFTCGVYDWDGKANYTEDDVAEAARALSGWVISPSDMGNLHLGLTGAFAAFRWDSGTKTFMEKTGNWNAQNIVDIIFEERSDSIAQFVCEKIYKEFVYFIPDKNIVGQMAETFQSNNWNIRPVVEQLLRSQHFFDSVNLGAKHKSPLDYFVGMVRGLNLGNITDFDFSTSGRFSRLLSDFLAAQGQQIFSPPNVKGWEGGRLWISASTAPPRQKWALDVMDQKIKAGQGGNARTAFVFDPIAFAKQFSDPNDIQSLAEEMAQYLLNIAPSKAELDALYDVLLDNGKDYEWNIDDPAQRAGERIRKFIKATVQLAKFQLF